MITFTRTTGARLAGIYATTSTRAALPMSGRILSFRAETRNMNTDTTSLQTKSVSVVGGHAHVRRNFVDTLVNQLVAPEKPMRLDNILSQNGLCPRKYARQFCRNYEVVVKDAAGKVTPVLTGATKVNPAHLLIDGEALSYAGQQLHIVMNKPAGYVCTHADDEGDNVYEIFPKSFLMRKPTLSSIGRLDKDASGLLLFTQSGALNARLTSPRRHCRKEYIVSLQEALSPSGIEAAAFASGSLQLVDGANCKPATLIPHKTDAKICKVILTEGRYHQLRRMFAAVGHRVTAIHRVAFADLRLADVGLEPGQWRLLTSREMESLIMASDLKERPGKVHGERARLRREAQGDYADVSDLNIADAEDYSDVDVED